MLRVYHNSVDLFDSLFDFKYTEAKYYTDVRTVSDGKTRKTFKDGILHSVDGKPAIIEYNEKGQILKEVYFWEGEKTTKESVIAKIQDIEDKKEHLVNLGGKQYKITGKKLKEIEKTFGLVST